MRYRSIMALIVRDSSCLHDTTTATTLDVVTMIGRKKTLPNKSRRSITRIRGGEKSWGKNH